jgi:hypothetical protein
MGLIAVLFASLPDRGNAGEYSAHGEITAKYFTSTRTLDDRDFAAGLAAEPKLRYSANQVLAYADLRGMAEYPWRDGQDWVREMYGDISGSWLALRVGKQILKWGRADEINPTDNLAVFDYTLLTTDRDAMRTGGYALKADAYWKALTLEAVAVPWFKASRIPTGPGFDVRDEPPGFALRNSGGAVKADYQGSPMDASVSYFYGYLPRPYISLGPKSELAYFRAWVVGGDFGEAIGSWGVRGEGAWTIPDAGPEGYHPFFSYVIGIDRTIHQDYYANVQFIEGIVPDYQVPEYPPLPGLREAKAIERALNNQAHRVTNAASVRISYQQPDNRWKASVTGILNLTDRDYLIRPKFDYGFSDHWKGSLGLEYNHGKDATFFGQSRKNNAGFSEIEFLF